MRLHQSSSAQNGKDSSGSLRKIPGKKPWQENALRIEWSEKRKNFRSLLTLLKREITHLPPAAQPAGLRPMLATLADAPFTHKDWQFEIKWDGYRALACLQNGDVQLRSRNNLSFNEKYEPVAAALDAWPVNAVVDGEIVVLNDRGKADFSLLQQWTRNEAGELAYYVFDLLWLEGYDLMNEPLEKRQFLLKRLVPEDGLIRFSGAIDEWGEDFFAAAQRNGLEGIIAKQKSSVYLPGYRTESWYKIKVEQRSEAVICGYTKNKDTQRLFSSLVLGVPEEGKFKFIGQVGTGFTGALQKYLFKKMNPLFTNECPFDEVHNTGAPTLWVKPHLVCEVKYTQLTAGGLMRHPSFQGLREDKTINDFNEQENTFLKTREK